MGRALRSGGETCVDSEHEYEHETPGVPNKRRFRFDVLGTKTHGRSLVSRSTHHTLGFRVTSVSRCRRVFGSNARRSKEAIRVTRPRVLAARATHARVSDLERASGAEVHADGVYTRDVARSLDDGQDTVE